VATGPAPPSDAVSANDGAAASASLAASSAIAAAGEGGSGNGPGRANGHGNGTDAGAGSGGDDSDAMEAYLSDVRARLQRSLIYPPKARRIGLRGEVRIRMRILADGSIDPDSVHVVGEGGNPVLIAGALETVERVALTPPPRPRIEIVAPIHFRLD
jgi:TonB family protein